MNSHPALAYVKSRVGRPRRGTESARTETLIAAATRMFLQEGYGCASIDKVAAEAGVSTRTIYERFKNKGELALYCEHLQTVKYRNPESFAQFVEKR